MSALPIREHIISAITGNFETASELIDLVLEFLKTQGEHIPDYLHCFLADISPVDLGIRDINAFFNLSESNQPSESIKDLEDRIVDGLIKNKVDENEFYRALAQRLFDATLIPNTEERNEFLMLLWIDVRIPYFRLDEGCVLTDNQFVALQKEIEPQLKKAKHIIFRWDLQKTQQSSLLVALSKGIEDENQRAVFWATVLSTYAVVFASMMGHEENETTESERLER